MMVGTANDTKSDPALTSNRITAFTRPDARDLDEVVAGFTTPVEPAGDVVGQREAALDDPVPLALERRRIFGHALEFAEHVSDIRVFRVRS